MSRINTSTTQSSPIPSIYRSNILSATGLPRAALAAMFRRDGLFGRDSRLSLPEQAVLQSRLPDQKGLKTPVIAIRSTLRLAALADLADVLIAGRNAARAQAQARRAGLDEAAIAEAETVIENVRVVFGLTPRALPLAPKKAEKAEADWWLAHAA